MVTCPSIPCFRTMKNLVDPFQYVIASARDIKKVKSFVRVGCVFCGEIKAGFAPLKKPVRCPKCKGRTVYQDVIVSSFKFESLYVWDESPKKD